MDFQIVYIFYVRKWKLRDMNVRVDLLLLPNNWFDNKIYLLILLMCINYIFVNLKLAESIIQISSFELIDMA